MDIWILLDPSCIVATVKFGISNRFTAGDKPENNVKWSDTLIYFDIYYFKEMSPPAVNSL